MSDRGSAGEMITIGNMAKRFGVTLRTLRFYERKGLITPERLGRARYYRQSDVQRFARIHAWASAGISLAEISEMLATDDEPDRRRFSKQLEHRLDEIEARLRAQLAAIEVVRTTL